VSVGTGNSEIFIAKEEHSEQFKLISIYRSSFTGFFYDASFNIKTKHVQLGIIVRLELSILGKN
jgi:hypothetical protein